MFSRFERVDKRLCVVHVDEHEDGQVEARAARVLHVGHDRLQHLVHMLAVYVGVVVLAVAESVLVSCVFFKS